MIWSSYIIITINWWEIIVRKAFYMVIKVVSNIQVLDSRYPETDWICWKRQSAAAAAAKSLQSCPALCDPIDGSLQGFPVPGILQERTIEWVAIFFSNEWKWKVKVKSESEDTQSCPTLRDLMDCSPPGSCVHGIFQARVLEWGAIAFSEISCYITSMTQIIKLTY